MNARRCLLLLLIAAGCTSVPPVRQQDGGETALRARVQAWWNARIAIDHKTMYDLLDPEFRRQKSYEAYVPESIQRSRIPVKEVEIMGITRIGDDKAEVALRAMNVARASQPLPTEQTEVWVLRDGAWFKQYQPPRTPFDSLTAPPK